MATSQPKIVFIVEEQVFRIKAVGLMPFTYHSFYVERQKVSFSNLKQVGGLRNTTLQTDTNGQIEFDYFYNSGITGDETTMEQAQQTTNMVAGIKEAILASSTSSILPINYAQIMLSHFRTHIGIEVVLPAPSDYTQVDGGYDPQSTVLSDSGGGMDGGGRGGDGDGGGGGGGGGDGGGGIGSGSGYQ